MDGAWGKLHEAAAEIELLADQAESLLARVAALVDDTVESDDTAPGIAAPVSRKVAVAAARLRHAVVGVQVVSAGLVEANGVHHCDAARSPRLWLALHGGLTHRQASALCRSAAARNRFRLLDRAFCEGEITAGHLEAVAGIVPARLRGEEREQVLEAVAEIQPTLLECAGEMSLDQFIDLCARIRHRLDDGPGDRSAEPSRVWLSRTFDGRWSLRGDLSAVDGAILASMLDDAVAAMKEAPEPSDQTEPSEQTEQPEATEQPDRCRLDSERRAVALSELLGRGAGTTRPGRISLFVHVDLEDLRVDDLTLDELARRSPNAHTEAGIDIDVESLWDMLAGADVTPVFNWTGNPLSYGRTRRLAPPVLRRVLAHRDRTCRFPGCTVSTSRAQLHHVVAWDGPEKGETNPSNLAHLDPKHHHDHHDRGFTVSGDANGDLSVTRPDRTPLTAAPAYRGRLRQQRDADRDRILERLLYSDAA